MASLRISVAVLGMVASAAAQIGLNVPGPTQCDGRWWPDYDACDVLHDGLMSIQPLEREPGLCHYANFDGAHNCRLRVCFPDNVSERWFDLCYALSIDIDASHRRITETCKPLDAGGYVDWYNLSREEFCFQYVLDNDPNWIGRSSLARRSGNFNETELLEKLASASEVLENGVHHWTLSQDSMQALIDAEAASEAQHGNEEHAVMGMPAVPAEDSLSKRQDRSFITRSHARAVRNPDVREVAGPILGSGASYTIEFSQTISVGVSVSMEVGGEAGGDVTDGLEASLSASLGVELSMDMSISYSESYTFESGECSRGQNYIYPLFDRVTGHWSDQSWEDDMVVIWIPRGGDDYQSSTLEFAIVTECLGS